MNDDGMNDEATRHHPGHCGEDVAAYALGALEPDEAQRFRRHLESCAVCQHELGSFRQVVDDLAASPPRYDAPPGLRRRVMRAVAAEPRPDAATSPRGRRRRLPRPALALGGVAAGLAVAAVALVLALGSGSSTHTITAHVSGRGSAVLRVADDRGRLVVRGLAAPPRGKIYEVWEQRGHAAPKPASALFGVTRAGDADVDIPGSLRGVSLVMVTPERAGGSPVPTHSPVITAGL